MAQHLAYGYQLSPASPDEDSPQETNMEFHLLAAKDFDPRTKDTSNRVRSFHTRWSHQGVTPSFDLPMSWNERCRIWAQDQRLQLLSLWYNRQPFSLTQSEAREQ